MLHTIHYLDKKAPDYLSTALLNHYMKNNNLHDSIVIVCIGTERCSGDSLGPLVGKRLDDHFAQTERVHIYGTLEKPVHALNLHKTMTMIETEHENPYIIAVDACLGRFYKIGTLQLVEAPLEPGSSLNKQLSAIGDIHIKGIVNNFGPLNYRVLEHTSLTHVKGMAATLSNVLIKACERILPNIREEEPAASAQTTATSSL